MAARFAAIGKLTSLESLNLKRTKIHGEGLRHLETLTKLKALDLGETQLDDSDLSQFGKLTQLESLSLENTPITGAGFGDLKGLVKLTALNFNKTRVGDSALRQFGTKGHPANKAVILRRMRPDGSEPAVILGFLGGQGTINVNSLSPDSKRFAFVAYLIQPGEASKQEIAC